MNVCTCEYLYKCVCMYVCRCEYMNVCVCMYVGTRMYDECRRVSVRMLPHPCLRRISVLRNHIKLAECNEKNHLSNPATILNALQKVFFY
jgi:hypothetical protein